MKMRVEELIHPKQNVEGPLRRQQDPPAHGDKSKELVVASEEMPPPHAIPNVSLICNRKLIEESLS